ncbi:MAG: hypothetical protein ACRDAO_04410 [Culicoidibacterales bacterium]
MKISSIEKLTDLEYQVQIVDNDLIETFIVLEDTLLSMQIVKPQPIERWQYEQLKTNDAHIYRMAIHYLSFRIRSRYELEHYLLKKEATADQTNNVIQKLIAQGYINDFVFAQAYVKTAMIDYKQGPKKIEQVLKQKHRIDEDALSDAMQCYSHDQQYENCEKLYNRLIRTNKKYTGYMLRQQIQQKLQLAGYSAQIIQSILQQFESEQNNELFEQISLRVYRRLIRETDPYKKRQKFQQKMYQYGFSSECSRVRFEQMEEDNEEN